MKATVIVENSVPIDSHHPFCGEHGFSLLLETAGKKILLDTGQTGIVVQNLSLLGVHPAQLDVLVLSHGHYDHAGGLPYILTNRTEEIPVYAHSGIFIPRYSTGTHSRHYVGIPYLKEDLALKGADWRLSSEPAEIAPRLWFSGQLPRITAYETGDTRLVTSTAAGCDCQDPIADDTVLYYADSKGLVVIGGCTHSGLVNAVRYGMTISGATRLRGWIGGTHLGPVSGEQQNKTLDALENFAPDFIAAGHCTGFTMMAELHKRFGERFTPALVSTVIEF